MDDTTAKSETTATTVSRREFLGSGAAGVAAGVVAGAALAGCATGAPPAGARGQRVLLKGGVVLTMDPRLGDWPRALVGRSGDVEADRALRRADGRRTPGHRRRRVGVSGT